MTAPQQPLPNANLSEQGMRELEVWLEKKLLWTPWVYFGAYPDDLNSTPRSPAFQNSWENVGAGKQRLRFRRTVPHKGQKINSLEIEGQITGGVAGSIVGVLPETFRPKEVALLTGPSEDLDIGIWKLRTNGELVFLGTVGGGSGGPTGIAGGVLDGTYPDPGLAASVAGDGLAETSDVLSVNVDNSTIEINSDTLRVKSGGIGATQLASTAVTPATYGDATHVGQFTVDADGRLTAASSVAITGTGGGSTVVDHGNAGSTETIDVSAGDWQRLTLNASCTITVTGYSAGTGVAALIKVTQDGTGGWAITWDPDVVFLGNSQPSTAASSVTYFMLWSDAGDSAIYGAKVGGTITEDDITLSDVTTDNVTSSAHGFAPKSPADATKFLNGATTPAYANVKDSDLSTTDITTNNVSTSKHGFAPKAPADATKYLDGTGAYSVPAGSGSTTWSVLTDGIVATPALVFAAGDVIMVKS